MDSDEDEEDEENVENVEDEENEILLKNKENNVKTESEIDDFIKLCRNYFDKKQTKKENINGTSNEIILEKKKETCHDEKNNTLEDNRSENSTLQLNASDIKSKLCSSEKNDTLHTNTNDTKNKSCNNEESNNSLANVKDKIRKRKKSKENLKFDNVDATSEHNKKLKSQDKNEILNSKSLKRKKSKLNVQEVKKKCKANNKMEKHDEDNEDYWTDLEFEDLKRKPILDSPLEETISRETAQKESNLTNLKTITNNATREPADISYEAEIDPKKYVNIKPKHLKTQLPDVITGGDEDSEQEEETHKIMSEAFADDDVVEEFRKEKEEEVHIKILNKNYTSYTYIKMFSQSVMLRFAKKCFCWDRLCITNIE